MKYLFLLFLLSFNLSSQTIYKTIPGTPFKDITEPVMVIDKNVIYKTIPGTPYKDITEPLMVIEKNGIYPTLPGTTLRDYSVTPQFVIE
jgi:hypothetical protein